MAVFPSVAFLRFATPGTTSYRGTVRTSRASGYFFRLATGGLDAKIEFMNVL